MGETEGGGRFSLRESRSCRVMTPPSFLLYGMSNSLVLALHCTAPLYCPPPPSLFYPLQVPRPPPPPSSGDKYVALVSGLGLGRPEADMLKAGMGGGRG